MANSVLCIEYENVLMGNVRKFTNSTLRKDLNRKNYVPLLRYVFEEMLGWDKYMVRQRISMNVIRALRLERIIQQFDIPQEIDLEKQPFFLAHLIYPDDFKYDRQKAVLIFYDKLLHKQIKRLKKAMFEGSDGMFAAKVCLNYAIENYLPYGKTEYLYEFFSNEEQANRFLRKYKLGSVCELQNFEHPIDLLHESLVPPRRSELFYRYYTFIKEFQKRKDDYICRSQSGEEDSD